MSINPKTWIQVYQELNNLQPLHNKLQRQQLFNLAQALLRLQKIHQFNQIKQKKVTLLLLFHKLEE